MNDFAFHRGVSRNARTGSVGTPVIKSNRRLTTFFSSSDAASRAIRAGGIVLTIAHAERSIFIRALSWSFVLRGFIRDTRHIERQKGLNNIYCTKLCWKKIVEKYDTNLEKFVIINLNDN